MSQNSTDNGTHYPECDRATHPWSSAFCICSALRACEQRILGGRSIEEYQRQIIVKNFDAGYAEALDKATEAVAAVPRPGVYHKDWLYADDALAVADALREPPTGPDYTERGRQ